MTKELITRLRDDLDRTLGDDIETYPFAWRGVAYEIELSAENVARMDAAMAPFIEVARKAQPPRKRTRKPATVAPPIVIAEHRRKRTQKDREHSARVRAWANKHGFTVGNKGKIPLAAQEAYARAH